MSELIKVVKDLSWQCIDIEMTNICNYNCYYCRPADWKPKDILDYEKLVSFLDKYIEEKEDSITTVIISGGEPTLHPRLDDLLRYFHAKNVFVSMVSNGSKNVEWWKENIQFIDRLMISYQYNSTIKEEFIEKLKVLTEFNAVQINFSMLPDKFDECMEIAQELSKIDNVLVVPKALVDKFTEHRNLYNYTDEQRKVMGKVLSSEKEFSIELKKPPIVRYQFDDNLVYDIPAYKIILDELNQYKDWLCWKGTDGIRIVANGDLYLAGCDYRDKISYDNINNDNVELPHSPIVCTYDHCFCMTDILNLRKEKI